MAPQKLLSVCVYQQLYIHAVMAHKQAHPIINEMRSHRDELAIPTVNPKHYKRSAGLEEQDGHLAEVEVDEVLCLMCDIRAEIPAHNGMPCGVVLLVEFLF